MRRSGAARHTAARRWDVPRRLVRLGSARLRVAFRAHLTSRQVNDSGFVSLLRRLDERAGAGELDVVAVGGYGEKVDTHMEYILTMPFSAGSRFALAVCSRRRFAAVAPPARERYRRGIAAPPRTDGVQRTPAENSPTRTATPRSDPIAQRDGPAAIR